MADELEQCTLEAEQQLVAKRFFEGVQSVNKCMEIFEPLLGGKGNQILKDPAAFREEFLPRMSDHQKTSLNRLYTLRGDLLTGLGATKRAGVDYSAAASLCDADEPQKKVEIEARMARVAVAASDENACRVPCSILTGFLGSGKTTLLNHILNSQHGKRIAVIENEFGEVGIDDKLVQGGSMAAEENIVEMNNGCICCTVRGDLIAGLKKIFKAAKSKGRPLDGVLIETTGLADPAPVAQTFFADDFIQQHFSIDGIITLVDAKHVIQHLDEEKPEGVENEAVEQIAFADRIMLNKCDLVDEATIEEVERRIRAINATVPVKRTTNSTVDMDFILGIKAFSLDKILEQEGEFLDDGQEHQHDDRVSSVGIDVPGDVDSEKLGKWIGWLLKEKGTDLFRSKGVLAVRGEREKFVFQAIHMLFSNSRQRIWSPDEERRCRMIFIGKNLDRQELTAGFLSCMAA